MYLTPKGKPILYYNHNLVKLASQLRKSSTLSETLVWNCLKNGNLQGYDFHRQKPIGNYIVDFFCYELMLAIEIDGCSHEFKEEYDVTRTEYLESLGITVLRFYDNDVKENVSGVADAIVEWVGSHAK